MTIIFGYYLLLLNFSFLYSSFHLCGIFSAVTFRKVILWSDCSFLPFIFMMEFLAFLMRYIFQEFTLRPRYLRESLFPCLHTLQTHTLFPVHPSLKYRDISLRVPDYFMHGPLPFSNNIYRALLYLPFFSPVLRVHKLLPGKMAPCFIYVPSSDHIICNRTLFISFMIVSERS